MIVITGASRGLGNAIAHRLISRDIEVFGIARDPSSLSFPAMRCDVSSYEEVRQVGRHLKGLGQPVTGLINAAGVASMNLAVTTPPELVERIVATNLLGTIYCCQTFGRLIIRNKCGAIINFSTIAVALGLKGESVYAASKAGVEGFTRAFAREMADFNVTVNCIAPGPIATDLLKGVPDEQISDIIAQQVIKKQFSADAVSDLVEVLFDDKSQSLSGQVLHVGGV